MSHITANDVKIALGPASTWGTAIDLTTASEKLCYASALSVVAGAAETFPNDAGFGNFIDSYVRLQQNVQIGLTADLSYGGQYIHALAAVMGTATASPAEQNVGEGDYLHNLDLASTNTGDYSTLAWLVEDDEAEEVPSVKWTDFTVNLDTPGTGTVTINGLGDQTVANASVENTAAEIGALAFPNYERTAFCGANHYVRLAPYSTGTALDSSNDFECLNCSFTVSRPMNPVFVARGANSCYTKEPIQGGKTTGTFSVQLSQIDSSEIDINSIWSGQTKYMAEVFIDGAIIGAGDNRSLKFQFPYLELQGSKPSLGFSGNQDLRQPTLTFNMLKASTAPAGMTGVTNYLRIVSIDERSASYL